MEDSMFHVVGWIVVTGFVIYGLKRFVSKHVMA